MYDKIHYKLKKKKKVFSNITVGGWGVRIKCKAKYFRAPDKLGLDSVLCCL